MTSDLRSVKLQSSDGDIFDVDVALIEKSEVLKGFAEIGGDCIIPLNNINSTVLKKVIEWMEYHKNDSDNDNIDESDVTVVSDWDSEFLKVEQGLLFELVLAANYLNIKKLLDVTCTVIANAIKGKAPEEIRRTFNIKSVFTPQEEEQIRKENEWCEEK